MSGSCSLSDDAIVLGMAHFISTNSTLSFGGDDAKMEITPRARSALSELIEAGFVEVCEPLDSWPNREHYRCLKSVLPIPKDRPHLNPFTEEGKVSTGWATFSSKGLAQKEKE